MILKNLWNTIPLHSSADEWYENKKTYHGVDRYPVLPCGVIPSFSIFMVDNVATGADVVVYNALTEAQCHTISLQASRTASCHYFSGKTVADAVDGIYYYTITANGETFISEPFRWESHMDGFVHIHYRRSTNMNIGTRLFFWPTGEYFDLYLPGEIMMPEYQYDEEVEDLDGVQFVRKRVSYKKHKFTTLCTDYTAEALRLMWHCNDITIMQHGETYDVDYMEAPQVSWGDDNHLAEVDLVFHTDNIIQTNGESSENTGVTSRSFDGSFDGSFN